MNIFIEDLMPRTASAIRGLRRVERHRDWVKKNAVEAIIYNNHKIEAGSFFKEALYSECCYQDEKIDDASFAVKYWRREMIKAASLEGGGWLAIFASIFAFATPYFWI